MKRLLKWASALIGLVVVSVVAIVVIMTTLVNPEQFKPQIISQFKQFTGFEMTIPGKLSWSFYPHIGMQADEVVISDHGVFNSKITNLTLRMKFGPLLHHQLELSKVSIGEIQFNQLHAANIGARVKLNNQTLEIQPVRGEFYEGNLNSQASISLKQTPPVMHIATSLKNISMAALLTGLSGKPPTLQFDGRGNVIVDVTTSGKKADELLQKLNGTSRFNLDKGVIKGIDIDYLVQTAVALINNQPAPDHAATKQTEFGQLTGTAVITNGVAESNDTVIDTPLYTAKGSGSIDLVNKTLDYTLLVTVKAGKVTDKLQGVVGKTIPIRLTGDLNNPKVNLDTLALMKAIGKEQLEKVGERIQKALPENANNFLKKLFN